MNFGMVVFVSKQVESPQWYIYKDKNGAEYFVHLEFIDKCTGGYWIEEKQSIIGELVMAGVFGRK